MKKLMTVCAACLVAGMVTAQVESQNIVGYQTETTPAATYKMYGAVFAPVGNPNASMSINDLLSGNFQAGDELQFLVPGSGYTIYTYYVGDLISADYTSFDGTGWGISQIEADYLIPTGEAFWIKTGTALDLVQAGEVQIAANNEVSVPAATFSLISAPYPTAYDLSSLTITGIQAGDQAQFLVPGSGYTIYTYYVGDLISADYTSFDGTGWGISQIEADYTIASAEGFWAFTGSTTTWTFSSPL